MYTVEITRETDAADLERVFAAEDTEFPNGRARYDATADDQLVITGEADDTSSLKALTNSITTVLEVYDDARQIQS